MAHDQNHVRSLYKKLLTLYPPAFREQLGESMEQTFNDLYSERARERKQGLFSFVLGMFFETGVGIIKENIRRMTQGDGMKNSLTNPGAAALISFLIAFPFMLLEFIFVTGKRLKFDRRDALDSIVVFGFCGSV